MPRRLRSTFVDVPRKAGDIFRDYVLRLYYRYREDVSTVQFNTYSAFVTLYGREAPVRMRAEIDRYERMFKTRLAASIQTVAGA